MDTFPRRAGKRTTIKKTLFFIRDFFSRKKVRFLSCPPHRKGPDNQYIVEPAPLQTRTKGNGKALSMMEYRPSDTGLMSLPREIRDQIFREVMGGKEIYLAFWGEKRCLLTTFANHPLVWPDEYELGKSTGMPVNWLGLVLACRQTYSESINLLYSENMFAFRCCVLALEFLPTFFLPQRLNAIRYIRIAWEIVTPPSPCPNCFHQPAKDWAEFCAPRNCNYRQWVTIWDILAGMQSLKHLRLELMSAVWGTAAIGGEIGLYWDWRQEDLEVVRKVTRPEKITIAINGFQSVPRGVNFEQLGSNVEFMPWFSCRKYNEIT